MTRFIILAFACIQLLACVSCTSTSTKHEYVTAAGKVDGFGAQLQSVMSAIAFAEQEGYTYLHSPFRRVDHNYQHDPEYSSKLESFGGMGFGDLLITEELREQTLTRPHFHTTIDGDVDKYYTKKTLKKLRQKYYSSPKPGTPWFRSDRTDIAVHIRRGDVSMEDLPNRFTDNATYSTLISKLRNQYRGARFHVFSQGELEDFAELVAPDVEFHLNDPVTVTFHALVSADVLVTAKSSFSYSAALLSSGDIHYMRFWHSPLKHWNIVATAD